jgi:phosphate/phosphite/phosphonate ABC transporter binding protein
MAYLDPAAYCEVRARYKNRVAPLVRAIGKQDSLSRSVLVAKAGSSIEKIVDIKGKRLALGSRQSSFSYLVPLAMLYDVGIGMKDFSFVDYLQQEDRVALSVLIDDYDVGAMSESVAGKYVEDGLRIIKRSEVIPQFVLCVSNILPAERKKDIVKSLVSDKGKETLSAIDHDMEGFVAAEDRDFDVIRVMMKNITGRDYIEYGPRTIKVAILPLYSAITIYERYEPLMRYLSRETGYEFKLVIPKDFDDFVRIVKSGRVDFSYQNPYIFALIDRDRDIKSLVTTIGEDIASADGIGGGDSFSGIIITRHDSAIRNIKDLRGKRVMIVSRKSAGGYLSQKLFLDHMGIDTEKDMRIIDAKRQENVIFGVYRGEADAGFVRESALVVWKEEIDMKKMRILARTKALPNWPFALCGNVNSSLVNEVRRLLIQLNDAKILKAARVKGFEAARESDFDVLKRY